MVMYTPSPDEYVTFVLELCRTAWTVLWPVETKTWSGN